MISVVLKYAAFLLILQPSVRYGSTPANIFNHEHFLQLAETLYRF